MQQLKMSKQVVQAALDGESTKKTGGLLGGNVGTLNTPFVEGSPVDILLFGQRKTANSYSTSFGQTGTSEQNMGQAQIVAGLKHIIRVCNITTFAISTTGPDGSRLYTQDKIKAMGGSACVPQETLLSTKIQMLLDQRKPPTEEMPSLVDQYDDELNPI